MGLKKIVLITTGQPSCNPRIVKEADALHAAGYEVTVLYNYFVGWAEENDTILLSDVGWEFYMAGGSPLQNIKRYRYTRLRNKLAAVIGKLFGNQFLLAERMQARAYDELLRAAKKIKADWYIGHNLGALAVAVNAAKFHGSKAGFDFEDYYRGEISPQEKNISIRIHRLEKKYLPALSYFSAASEMILSAVQKDHPEFKGKVVTLNNCFPLKQQPLFKEKDQHDCTLQLFWFSQTIGINRGLETLIDALMLLNNSNIHLTLAGRCNATILSYIETHAGAIKANIYFVGIIQPDSLAAFAAQFDVGMALELQTPCNRDICLTNKVFTYLLAGNAMILSETAMQLAFNKRYKIGYSYAVNNVQGLVQAISFYLNKKNLDKQRTHNYLLAKNELNWELESKKLLDVIE